MHLVLLAGRFDASAEGGAGFGDAVQFHQELRAAEEGVDVGRGVGHEALEEGEAFVGAIFVVVFAGEAVAEELVLWLGLEHGFDFFAT